MTTSDLAGTALASVLDRLGSSSPTPGGGTAAALGAALGAALVGKLARLSVGAEAKGEHAALLGAVGEEAEALRTRLCRLADEDAAAYEAVLAARRRAGASAEDATPASAAVAEALQGAIDVPLRIMEACVETIALARSAIERGQRSAVPDGAVGAELCRAGLRAAAGIVRANLAALEDAEHGKAARTRMDEMLYMGTKACAAIDSYVGDLWP